MVNKYQKLITILIILLAAVLRLWRLGDYPALNADEASIGYDAYSLIETGKDQHGNPWPIHFQSFNDFKPGLVVYLVLPFVKIFGLSAWSIRLPGALLGVATVYMLYLLVREIFKKRLLEIGNWKLEILAAAMLTISPWHIHFSRGIWEVNIATFFMLMGVYLFIKGINSQKYLVFSVLNFVLSLYTYHSARVVVPLLVLGILFIYKGKVLKNTKKFLIAGAVGLVVLLPLGYDLTKGAVLSRAAGVVLFADPGMIERVNEQRSEHGNFTGLFPLILHNKIANYGLEFLKNYSEHFHGLFLFVSGEEIERNRVPETGQMYLFDILFVLIGFFYILRTFSLQPKAYGIIMLWLLIAPIAAALTFQSPHALRAQNMAVPLAIISSLGMVKIVLWLNSPGRQISLFALGVFVFWNFTRYQHMYWVHMTKEYPFSSQYGLKELVGYINSEDQKFEKVLVTDKYDQPYIMFLFYKRYPPQEFQSSHKLSIPDRFGFSTVRSFGKYEFRGINWDEDKLILPNSLIVGAPEEIPDGTNIVKNIYGSNNIQYFKVVAN
jgi:4-amino-4-deoxy-L-arabinose transferase-like glycosyltransferase